MKSSVVHAFGVFASVLVAGAAGAQSTQAVEWKVSEGGNGHWYLATATAVTRSQALVTASGLRGYLATITSSQENQFLAAQNFPSAGGSVGYWIGGVRASAGSGSWSWITGEPWTYSNFDASEPNGCCGQDVRFTVFRTYSGHEGRWDDTSSENAQYTLVEMDSDCNGDGIVDYGQIRSGQLADDNANGVPDVCETSITGVIPPSVPSQGGSVITINGRNFPAQPTVLVGNAPATNVVRISDTRLTAIAPAGLPGMQSITVNGFTLTDGIYYRPECGSDLDQDGEVTAADIAIVLLDFGPCYVTATTPQSDDPKPFMLQDQPAPAAPQSR